MKKIAYMDTSFRDGFQSSFGARVKCDDFLPALEAAVAAGTDNFEIGGGARFQSLYFYCQEDAFDMMDRCRSVVGPDINLQTLSRGANVVGLISQSRDIIELHARMFQKHGVSTIRNFDALNDIRNLAYSGKCIHESGAKHQVTITLMGLPPGLKEQYAHTPKFYLDRLREVLDAEIPFDSVCFKDASGTATPKTVFDTIKDARKLLPEGSVLQFHTHDTAGMAVACNMAAIEGGADVIDLSMTPVSGGTCQTDILTMWHRLKGTDYALDIDYKKIIEAEAVFRDCMSKYFIPPEAQTVNPVITLSPMPGGALTSNTQMMRDDNTLELFPKVIEEMREVVERGGFGTSVTPVSQFYFQQAYRNVLQGKWKVMTRGYGRMLLGYFGRTPAKPDEELVKLAAGQLNLEPTTEDVHDINDANPNLGIAVAKKNLEEAGLETTDENIMIAATCEEKGIAFLKGDKPLGIRYVEKKEDAKSAPKKAARNDEPAAYSVTVDGRSFNVVVVPGGAVNVSPTASTSTASGNQAIAVNKPEGYDILAPMPGSVVRFMASEGDELSEGDTVLILEAMKMETEVKTEKSGVLSSFEVSQGDTVAVGEVLATIV
ncbi:MAG: biotin attachment protein [Kiritimatiellaeota bacterium]|nr:biotin attachment protein [Kiritimatiellota bacterium]